MHLLCCAVQRPVKKSVRPKTHTYISPSQKHQTNMLSMFLAACCRCYCVLIRFTLFGVILNSCDVNLFYQNYIIILFAIKAVFLIFSAHRSNHQPRHVHTCWLYLHLFWLISCIMMSVSLFSCFEMYFYVYLIIFHLSSGQIIIF